MCESRISLIWRLWLLSSLVIACSSIKSPNIEQVKTLIKLGDQYTETLSPSRNYTLYVQSGEYLTQPAKFIVLKNPSSELILENSFFPGYVKWISEEELEVLSVPGTLQKDEDLANYKKIIRVEKSKL